LADVSGFVVATVFVAGTITVVVVLGRFGAVVERLEERLERWRQREASRRAQVPLFDFIIFDGTIKYATSTISGAGGGGIKFAAQPAAIVSALAAKEALGPTLLDLGDDPDTVHAAASISQGLDQLFFALGPPPDPSAAPAAPLVPSKGGGALE
jgi:hypothetical protein